MAFGMKHWLGLVGTGAALVAILTLPPSGFEGAPLKLKKLPEQSHLDAIQAEIGRVNGQLRITRYMSRYVPAVLASPTGFTMQAPAEVAEEAVTLVRTQIEDQLASAGVKTDKVALGVFYAEYREGAYPDAPGGNLQSPEYYWGTQDGRDYCFTVLPLRHGYNRDGKRIPMLYPPAGGGGLGPCELIAKYGLPGPTVDRWLSDGGTSLAKTAMPSTKVDIITTRRQMGLIEQQLSPMAANFLRAGGSLADQQCAAGEAVGCAKLVSHPQEPWYWYTGGWRGASPYLIAHTPLRAVERSTLFQPFTWHFAADLSRDFGDARFETFWKSDKPFAEAFQTAFGTDLGLWSRDYVAQVLPMRKPGPGPMFDEKLSTVLLLALAAIIGGVWAMKRRVA